MQENSEEFEDHNLLCIAKLHKLFFFLVICLRLKFENINRELNKAYVCNEYY